MKTKSLLAVFVGALLWLAASPASAEIKSFPAGSLVIPMDECHQFTSHGIGQFYRQEPLCHCPTSPPDDGMLRAYGLVYRLLEHGIVVHEIISETKTTIEGVDFRIDEPASGAEAVVRYNQTNGRFVSFFKDNCAPNGSNKYIDYRGAPWVISASGGMALQAMQLMRDGSNGIGGTPRGAFDASDFYEVNVHMAQNEFEAPVKISLNTPPKALALLDLGGGGGGGGLAVGVDVLIEYLEILGLNTTGASGTACNPGAVFGQFSQHSDFANDCLATGDYFVLWAPHWEGTDRTNDAVVVEKIAAFAEEGNAVFAECAAIPTLEGDHLWVDGLPSTCGNNLTCESQLTLCGGFGCTTYYNAEDGHTDGHFMLSNGLVRNGLPKSYGISNTEGFIYRDLSNPFVQKAELRYSIGDSHTGNWRPATCPTCQAKGTTVGGVPGNSQYGAETLRLISSCAEDDYTGGNTQQCNRTATQPDSAYVDPDSNWDYFTVRFKDGDPAKGPILYLGGHEYDSLNPAGVRLVANTLLFLESVVQATSDPETREFARSAPIVTAVGGVVTYMQGTFLRDDPEPDVTTFIGDGAAKFEFPHTQGHIWGFDASTLESVPTDYYQLGVPQFDAKVQVPNGDPNCTNYFTGQCRSVFTNVATGIGPNRQMFFDTNSAIAAPLGLTAAQARLMVPIIRKGAFGVGGIRAEGFGGVDYSTMAVIPPSPVAGAALRPTMIYAGGTDGGMRAVCGDVAGACDQPGRELWNYIPRTQLPLLKENTQAVQGSPAVADMFGDFNSTGLRAWRTILAFQTGNGTPNLTPDQSPAVIALDVTDPGNPQIVWEVATPNPSTSPFNMGVGMRLAMGPVVIDAQTEPAVFVQTNNGGQGGAGNSVRALSAIDGSPLWTTSFDQFYPPPRTAGNPPVPASAIPAGVTAVDLEGNGAISVLLVPTIYGDLWLLNAETGQSVYGSNPLFRFSGDFQPIGSRTTVFKSGGDLYALIVSGGYVDTETPSAWIRDDVNHFAVAVKIESPVGKVPLSETDTSEPEVLFVLDLGTGNLGFSQALVAGDEVFIVTTDDDINSLEYGVGSGTLLRYDISEGTQTSTNLGSAIGSSAAIDINTGKVYVSGTDKAMQIDISADFDATGGEGVDLIYTKRAVKTLWLSLD